MEEGSVFLKMKEWLTEKPFQGKGEEKESLGEREKKKFEEEGEERLRT